MQPMYIEVVRRDDRSLHVTGARTVGGGEETKQTTVDIPDLEKTLALIDQIKSGGVTAHARGSLSAILGGVLFGGGVGEMVREAVEHNEISAIFLRLPAPLEDWPWELAQDTETGIRPAIDPGLVRVAGPRVNVVGVPPVGLLVLPHRSGAARATALKAATRGLAHRQNIDIFSADPATGPGVRRALESGGLLVHIENADQENVFLEDGPVPLERLGLGENVWLAVLGSGQGHCATGQRLREQGVPLVLGRQLEMLPHQASSFDRDFYRSLANGDSVVDAVVRARFGLLQTEGAESAAWAAPVLWSAPTQEGAFTGLGAFPPAVCRKELPREADELGELPDYNKPFDDLGDRIGHAVSAPVFIRDTVRIVRRADSSTLEAKRRMDALRRLGAEATLDSFDEGGLSPDEKVRRLADLLVEGISKPDHPLEFKPGAQEEVIRLSQQLALSPGSVRQATHAMLTSPVTCLVTPGGSEGERLPGLIAERCFGYYTRRLHGHDNQSLFPGPRVSSDGRYTAGGWLYRTVASNWRRDEVDPLQPDQPDPGTRMPLVARGLDRWRIYNGAWLVIHGADRLDPQTLETICGALGRGVFDGLNEDRQPFRLSIPRDFRIVLTSAWPLPHLPSSVPSVHIRAGLDQEGQVNRWMASVTQQLGSAHDRAESAARMQTAEALYPAIELTRCIMDCPPALASAMLTYACSLGGMPGDAVFEASMVYLSPRFRQCDELEKNVLRQGLQGRREAFFSAIAETVKAGRLDIVNRLAERLDFYDEDQTMNRARVAELSPERTRLAEWVRVKDSTSDFPLPNLGDRARLLVP